jgi:hypothetical protein
MDSWVENVPFLISGNSEYSEQGYLVICLEFLHLQDGGHLQDVSLNSQIYE